MTGDDYARAVSIARRACASQWRYLSFEDREEVKQDAAVEMWRSGNVTRVWWAAFDSALAHQGARRVRKPWIISIYEDQVLRQPIPEIPTATRGRPFSSILSASDDVEAEAIDRLTVNALLDRLPHAQRQAVEAVDMIGLTWGEALRILDLPESTFAYRRRKGLERLRELVSASTAGGISDHITDHANHA